MPWPSAKADGVTSVVRGGVDREGELSSVLSISWDSFLYGSAVSAWAASRRLRLPALSQEICEYRSLITSKLSGMLCVWFFFLLTSDCILARGVYPKVNTVRRARRTY
jgi:hypothetical protein